MLNMTTASLVCALFHASTVAPMSTEQLTHAYREQQQQIEQLKDQLNTLKLRLDLLMKARDGLQPDVKDANEPPKPAAVKPEAMAWIFEIDSIDRAEADELLEEAAKLRAQAKSLREEPIGVPDRIKYNKAKDADAWLRNRKLEIERAANDLDKKASTLEGKARKTDFILTGREEDGRLVICNIRPDSSPALGQIRAGSQVRVTGKRVRESTADIELIAATLTLIDNKAE